MSYMHLAVTQRLLRLCHNGSGLINIQYRITAKHDATKHLPNNMYLPHHPRCQEDLIQILSSTCQGLKESLQRRSLNNL